MEALRLVAYHFDNLENREPEIKEELGIFVSDTGKSARAKLEDFIKNLPSRKPYLGYDLKLYPQYQIEKLAVI